MRFYKNIPAIVLITVLIPILIVCIAFYTGNHSILLELTIAYSVLLSIILFILFISDKFYAVGLILLLIYSLLEIVWGSFIPYILLLPVICSFLLSISSSRRITVNSVIIIVNFLLLLEIIGILPLIKYPELEMTLGNYIIILILLNICTLLVKYYANILSIFAPTNNKTLDVLLNQKGYFKKILIRGLYNSIYTHFANNFLNRTIWNNSHAISVEGNNLLHLLTNSDKSKEASVSLQEIMQAIISYYSQYRNNIILKCNSMFNVNPHIFIPIIFDILDNYLKYGHKDTPISIYVNQKQLTFEQYFQNKIDFHYNRSLGVAKDLLLLTGMGDINVTANNSVFTVNITLV